MSTIVGPDLKHAVIVVPASFDPSNLGTYTPYDSSNPLPVSNVPALPTTGGPSMFKNLGANATLNVKATGGNVFSVGCHNANAADRWLQLHNTATVPAGAAVPVLAFLVPAGAQTIVGTDFFTAAGLNFATGIAFAFSTTRDTYTAGAAADQSTWIQYA